MIQEIGEDKDVGEREEGGRLDRPQSSWLEAGDGSDKDKAHSMIWASAYINIYFLSFSSTAPYHPLLPTSHPCHHGISRL